MSPSAFRVVLIAASLGAVGIGSWLATSGRADTDAAPASTGASPAGALARSGVAPPAAHTDSVPRTIEEASRLLELGASGDLTVDMNTRAALDVLLGLLGPEATPADFQRLEDALRRSMPGEAATQAIALVRHYDAYQRAATTQAAEQQPPASPEELKALLDKTIALRRQHFDEPTARALFGAEEELTRLDMAMNAIQADPKLSAQEKATQISALRERMPRDLPGLQAPVAASFGELDTQVAALRQQGATPAQIEQLRQRYLGEEAAKAMTEMEAQRAQWESRYQAYAQQKKAIVASASPDMAAQLDAALRQHFKEEELAAARAYDRNRTSTP
ncbi:lipase secretion chaperone [Piscinibacter gummiphilus]|uniref:Lipase helper protein n=1 Tax=Piscinibacter gummiphilus TaxID=946333 RepID=A0ABZ0CWN7_9BURK|nr:lipase secretion chaperone [Piscinibacter gummiphilus]WOB07362.1 lipase secretion chaperone [Piscinibacter gummiphilus]